MNISAAERVGVTVLTIEGERVDAHNSDILKEKIKELFDSGTRDVLVDLSDVRFIDSSGLGALVSGFKSAMSHHGRITLTGLQAQVYSMFELTRLHRVFDIYADVDEALASYEGK